MTSDFEVFSITDCIHYIYFPILILAKEPVFRFWMFSAKQGNYWYHFITSLVWRGPWLGIEPRTSRTRSQHSTTRLSRRRLRRVLKQWRKCGFTLYSYPPVWCMSNALIIDLTQLNHVLKLNLTKPMRRLRWPSRGLELIKVNYTVSQIVTYIF